MTTRETMLQLVQATGLGIVLAFLTSCGESQPVAPAAAAPVVKPILDVPAIAGRKPEEVSRHLGKPLVCEPIKYGTRCEYQNRNEVVYIDGLADWITVYGDMPYSEDALPLLGFRPGYPSFANEHNIRWEGHQNTLLIQLAPGGKGKVFFAYVKVRTP